jgi:hypothetical protein
LRITKKPHCRQTGSTAGAYGRGRRARLAYLSSARCRGDLNEKPQQADPCRGLDAVSMACPFCRGVCTQAPCRSSKLRASHAWLSPAPIPPGNKCEAGPSRSIREKTPEIPHGAPASEEDPKRRLGWRNLNLQSPADNSELRPPAILLAFANPRRIIDFGNYVSAD